jgi:uncharacterized membrane protein YfcA
MPMFVAAVFGVGMAAGAIAAVAGFGVGSLLTPLLIPTVGARLAVAAVAIPHVAGSALRMWVLRAHVVWIVLRSFGVTSALGGLAGALLLRNADQQILILRCVSRHAGR